MDSLRDALFLTATLSSLFYLFSIYTCIVLMNIFNACSLIQLKK